MELVRNCEKGDSSICRGKSLILAGTCGFQAIPNTDLTLWGEEEVADPSPSVLSLEVSEQQMFLPGRHGKPLARTSALIL